MEHDVNCIHCGTELEDPFEDTCDRCGAAVCQECLQSNHNSSICWKETSVGIRDSFWSKMS